MPKLTRKQKSILTEIFLQSHVSTLGVDAERFRVQHEQYIDLIDEFERDGLLRADLRREKGIYRVSIVVIPLLSVPQSKAILRNFELILENLKSSYRTHLKTPSRIDLLANSLELEAQQVRVCLSYMLEISGWWGSASIGDDIYDPNAEITPAEGILKIRSIRKEIARLQEWTLKRISDRLSSVSTVPLLEQLRGVPITDERVKLTKWTPPDWYEKLPNEVRTLMGEVHRGLANEMLSLSSMGVRTVIDMVCVDKIGDMGGFDKKLSSLQDRGYITHHQKEMLSSTIEAGNAAAHRGHRPSMQEINTQMEICEFLLKNIYILPNASIMLKNLTPSRPNRNKGKI